MRKPSPKLNDRQRLFAEHVVAGRSQTEAYKLAGYTATGNAAEVSASQLLRIPKVAAFIESLRAEAAKASALSKADVVAKLCEIVNSPPSAASLSNPLCELRMSKAGPFAAFPDKGRAIERLSKLCGWDAPEKHEVASNITIIIGGNAEA